MENPKRLDIARAVRERSPATKEDVADVLGAELGSKQFEKAFGNATEQGLVDPQGSGGDRWTLSKKGRRRLKAQAAG
jgi:hypothetical protein